MYTKSGVRFSAVGHDDVVAEEPGAVTSITATGLDADTEYSVTAYVFANGEMFKSEDDITHTLPPGDVRIDACEARFEEDYFYVYVEFSSDYPIDNEAIRIYWADNDQMTDYVTVFPNVNMHSVDSGNMDVKIQDEPAPRWMVIDIADIYGYSCDGTPIEVNP